MKAFIAYKFTGEPLDTLEPFMRDVVDAFCARDVDTYCSLFDEQLFQEKGYTQQEIFRYTFATLDACDFLFVVQTSNARSEGMLMEVGYSIAKQIPIIVAQHEEVTDTYIHELAHATFRFSTAADLCQRIAHMELPGH